MSTRRLARLGEQLRREITEIIRRDVRDPRIPWVTVSGVEVTSDLWLARVYVRLDVPASERSEALEGLEAAAPFIRRTLGRGLHIRRVPELRFLVDRSMEHSVRIESILKDLDTDGEPAPPADDEAQAGDTQAVEE